MFRVGQRVQSVHGTQDLQADGTQATFTRLRIQHIHDLDLPMHAW